MYPPLQYSGKSGFFIANSHEHTINLAVSGGSGNYQYSIVLGNIPPGLNRAQSTGLLTGTPTAAGVYEFTVKISDDQGQEVQQSVAIYVDMFKSSIVLGQNGDQSFAGVYEFENLTINDNVEITSNGISQLVIYVNGTLTLGKNVTIRVRNGYYANTPNLSAY